MLLYYSNSVPICQSVLVNNGAYILAAQGSFDVALFVQVKHLYGHFVFQAQRKGRRIHKLQLAGDSVLVRDFMDEFGVGVFARVAVVNAVHLRGL